MIPAESFTILCFCICCVCTVLLRRTRALSTAREQESLDFRRGGGKNPTAPGEGKESAHPLGTGTDVEKRAAGLADGEESNANHWFGNIIIIC